MATMPSKYIKSINVDGTTIPHEILAGYLQDGDGGAKDWKDIKDLVSGNFQFIISDAAANTPKNVTWINASGNTITGTLDANNAESPAIYFVPVDLRTSTEHAEYIAVGAAGSKTWEKIGHTDIDLSQYAKKATITLSGNAASAGAQTVTAESAGAQTATGSCTVTYKKADAATGSAGAGSSANTGAAGAVTVEGSNFSFTGTTATISIDASAQELLDHSYTPAGSISGSVTIAAHSHAVNASKATVTVVTGVNNAASAGAHTHSVDSHTHGENVTAISALPNFTGGTLTGDKTFVKNITTNYGFSASQVVMASPTVTNGVLSWTTVTAGSSVGVSNGTVGYTAASLGAATTVSAAGVGSAATLTVASAGAHTHSVGASGTATITYVTDATLGTAGGATISGASFSFVGTAATIAHEFGTASTVSLSTGYQPAGSIAGSQSIADHSHTYTAPAAHTHSIGLTDATVTGTASVAVSSHTHSVTVAAHTHSVSVSGNNYSD